MATVREEYNTGLTREQIANAFSRALNDMTDAQINALLAQKQNTLTFDNSPTSGSSNPVKSGGVFTAISAEATSRQNADTKQVNALTHIIDDGAKNIANWSGATQTVIDVTFTNNGDGTITTTSSGAAAARRQKALEFTVPASLPAGTYVLSGCPAGGISGTTTYYCLYIWDQTSNTRVSNNDVGNGIEFNWTPDPTHSYNISVDIRSGTNPNGLVFKPMICAKEVYEISPAFKKYVPSNAEMQSDITALQTSAQNAGKMLDYIKELGIKNRMPQVRRIGTDNSNAAATYTQQGVRFDVNADGSITVTRVSGTQESVVWLYDDFSAILADNVADGTYYITTGFAGSSTTARLRLKAGNNDFRSVSEYLTIPESTYEGMNVSIIVYSGFTGSITVKPMFVKRFLYDADTSWEPYAPTGQELLNIIHKYHTSASASLQSSPSQLSLQSSSQLMSVRPDSSLTVEAEATDIENGGDDV